MTGRTRGRRVADGPNGPRRTCGTMQVHHALLERFPAFRAALSSLEHDTRMRLTAAPGRWAPRVLPVVVHVVWRTQAENVSDAQVRSQIVALNRDFRRRNADVRSVPAAWTGLVADAGIGFRLERTVRVRTQRPSFATDDAVKSAATGGSDAVDPAQHLNLWVCTLADGILGYAQFPGGPAATDGVVIHHAAFGTTGSAAAPFNQGRTATHEVGHWLNLRHIWGDTPDCSGGDSVADTPNCEGPNYGRPRFPSVTCGNGPHGDMFMNYMDYVDDAAMVMFTAGQVQRMRAALTLLRGGLLPARRP